MITKRVGHVIRLQVGLTVLAALVAAGMAQDAMHAGLSALLGGAIVVMGRSYGTSAIMVKRGPQFVQLMNG